MESLHVHPATIRRMAIVVRGVVQGVGFRPFVYNAAHDRALSGWVQNEADTVRIEVQGAPSQLEAFLETLRSGPPPQARIDFMEVHEVACTDGTAPFEIRASQHSGKPRPTIPADLATCGACLEEIRTPAERRYRYPFTNCTNCGPRWSIIERLPYDRPRTSMASFAMCPDCQGEYTNPRDRRFHAQPIACPQCGPVLELLSPSSRCQSSGDEALRQAAEAVRAGRILALKGLGGFQLLADATRADTIALLRERKKRPHKPLAIMLRSPDEVKRYCHVSPNELAELASPRSPILLLRRNEAEPAVVDGVAPGNPYLGVMLPYTPLHHLLMEAIARPIVCTSGNLAEEPMAITTEDALERLGAIADLFLVHNRPIVRPVDDSVARWTSGGLQLLRRARGYAPLPIELDESGPTILAVGGHLKNTVALALGSQVVLSPHVGDLDSVLSVDVHRRAVRDLVDFFEVTPEAVSCDMHPDYASTRHAEELAHQWNVPLVRVQHHHAHVAACAAEHRLEGPVLGLAWDGTGYGPDGTVWGGEVLRCDGASFERVASLRMFGLAGGDRAVLQPRRSALGVLFEIFGPDAATTATQWFQPPELPILMNLLARGIQAPRTSSMGRLFDAVAAICITNPTNRELPHNLERRSPTEDWSGAGHTPSSGSSHRLAALPPCGLPAVISFEGQAAMALEFAADPDHNDAYPLPFSEGEPAVADWEPLVRAVLEDRAAAVPLGVISARFHNALAELAVAIARRCGCPQVVLTGGCFQNALLGRRARQRLLDAGFQVYTHREVPPGDGGIALGQVLMARRRLKETR